MFERLSRGVTLQVVGEECKVGVIEPVSANQFSHDYLRGGHNIYFSSPKCSVKFSSVMGAGLASAGCILGRCTL